MSLTVENLSFAYKKGAPAVLENISCSFKRGSFYGIFGANGSGKSTLLKLLAGELKSSSEIYLDDLSLTRLDIKSRAKLMAVGAQSDELILPFTVRECIKLGRYVWNDENPELIERLLQEWNAASLAERPFAELSGGEQQRIKLLRILAQDTPYILLDEPGSSLDWSRQYELYEKLQTIAHEQNKCIIMVCHDLYTAPDFVDRMLLLKGGRIIYSGDPECEAAFQAINSAFGRRMNKVFRQFNSAE